MEYAPVKHFPATSLNHPINESVRSRETIKVGTHESSYNNVCSDPNLFLSFFYLFLSFTPPPSHFLPRLFPVIYFVLSPVIPNFCALIFRLSSVIYLQSSHPHPHRLFPVIYKLAVNFTPNFFQSIPSHFQTQNNYLIYILLKVLYN